MHLAAISRVSLRTVVGQWPRESLKGRIMTAAGLSPLNLVSPLRDFDLASAFLHRCRICSVAFAHSPRGNNAVDGAPWPNESTWEEFCIFALAYHSYGLASDIWMRPRLRSTSFAIACALSSRFSCHGAITLLKDGVPGA